MGIERLRLGICALVLSLPLAALAQQAESEDVLIEEGDENTRDQAAAVEDGQAFVEEAQEVVGDENLADDNEVGGLFLSVRASTAIYATENRDYRPLDESSYQSIIDSDDRRDFGHSDITGTLSYRPLSDVTFDLQLKYDAIWKDDQLGRTAGSTGDLNVYRLAAEYAFVDLPEFRASVRLGRQPFSIGGVPNDYMLRGTLDAITAELDFRQFGRLRVLAIDFFGGNDLPQNGYQFYRDGRQTIFGQRGETNTLRSGVIYELDDAALPEVPIEARAYYFYAQIGGGPIESSGSDLTYGGTLGNYSDRDYQHMMGLRAAYVRDFEGGGGVRVFAELAHSEGIDRKDHVARDVDTFGNAYGGGATLELPISDGVTFLAAADFYHFDGARYASDGLEFERGFVSFKGDRIGGLAIGRLSAWRPSSYVDASGVEHAPHDLSRSGGTQFGHAGLGFDVFGTRLSVDYWMFTDTGDTFLNVSTLDEIDEPPFGYSREEFAAQARLGKALGQEFDIELRRQFNEIFALYTGYGLFMPGEFYKIPVSKVAGVQETALGGQEDFWVFVFGSEVTF